MQKSIANVILFLGEGDGNFLRYVRLYIFVTLNLSRGGIKGDLASVTKYVGFFIQSCTRVRGILDLISCICLFVCLSETNILSLRETFAALSPQFVYDILGTYFLVI